MSECPGLDSECDVRHECDRGGTDRRPWGDSQDLQTVIYRWTGMVRSSQDQWYLDNSLPHPYDGECPK